MRNYKNKVVVISGAAGGLGTALCNHFLALGAKVIACDLKEIPNDVNIKNLLRLQLDVGDFNSCSEAIKKVNKTFGLVDVLVNNAGISHFSDFRQTEMSVIEKVMRVNFFGSANLTKAALPDLIQTKGQIAVISSIAGFTPLLERTGYSASKHALHGFFDSLRAELESTGVKVSIVCPSFVATGIESAAMGGDGKPANITRKTVGKEMSPEEMASRIISGITLEKNLILPTFLSKLSWWINKISSSFFTYMMKKKVGRVAGPLLLCLWLMGTTSGAVAGSIVNISILDHKTHKPIPVVMVSQDENNFRLTRFSNQKGTILFKLDSSQDSQSAHFRFRKFGYKDKKIDLPAKSTTLKINLEQESDPVALAESKPALSWLSAMKFENEKDKKQFRLQCAFCHQQGSTATRLAKTPDEWKVTISRMIRYGSRLPTYLQKTLPEFLSKEWPRLKASPELIEDPAPWDASIEKVTIKEWPVGNSMSQTHDTLMGNNGLVYVADNIQDTIYELDTKSNQIQKFEVPHRENEQNGGLLAGRLKDFPSHHSTSNAHSLVMSKVDGHIFITPSAQKRLVEFDPKKKEFILHDMEQGFYPHTIRIDAKDRVWFTLALSNQVAMYDRTQNKFTYYDLPTRNLREKITVSLIDILFKLMNWGIPISNYVSIDEQSTGVPLPYGIEVTPEQKIWFARLHTQEIGMIDPETNQIEMIHTPFMGPRRLRTDEEGNLWITSYAESLISKFNPKDKTFKNYSLPALPAGNETPYALNFDPLHKRVWVTGNQSDTLMVLDVKSEKWTIIPMSRRTTFTRDVDFGPNGEAYVSNSNFPSWHIEDAQPTLIQVEFPK